MDRTTALLRKFVEENNYERMTLAQELVASKYFDYRADPNNTIQALISSLKYAGVRRLSGTAHKM